MTVTITYSAGHRIRTIIVICALIIIHALLGVGIASTKIATIIVGGAGIRHVYAGGSITIGNRTDIDTDIRFITDLAIVTITG